MKNKKDTNKEIFIQADVELISSETEVGKIESSETSPLNPLTNKNYADEIRKSNILRELYDAELPVNSFKKRA